MYDGKIGRWLSVDPMGQYASPYEGMGNNPVNSSDPTGGEGYPDCPKCTGIIGAEVKVVGSRSPAVRDNTSIPNPLANRLKITPSQPIIRAARLNGFALADLGRSPGDKFYYNLLDKPYVTINNLLNPFYDKTHFGGRLLSGYESVDAFVDTAPLLLGGELSLINKSAETITVFRAFGGDAKLNGFSWTGENPNNILNYRDGAGLPSGGPSGSTNTAQFIVQGVVKRSDIIMTRSALPLDGNAGGLPEYIINPLNVSNKQVFGSIFK